MSRTPENFGRKQINIDNPPGSVPPVRRPHSSASDRHNGIVQQGNVSIHRSMREKKNFIDSDDDELDEPKLRFKPVRVAPPIPIQKPSASSNTSSSGYDSLEKYRHAKYSQSDEGSLISSTTHSSCDQTSSVPGLIGVKNHGNTCYMNSVIQCLSNTEPLLHYILTSTYKKDLVMSRMKRRKMLSPSATTQPPSSPPNGQIDLLPSPSSDGAVTEYTGLLIKSLWNAQYEGKVSAFVKDVIALWSQQYRGNSQHDAQEFLLWLLDHLHEELNQATGERMTRSPSRKSNEEEELAAETLSDHLQRHDSLIYNLFSAQYHSSLRCPTCNHLSNTFDPYLCVSLSVPRRGTRPIYITMARRHQNSTRLMVFGMSLKVNSTVRDIQRQLSVEARTLPHYLVISDMAQDGFCRFFRSNDPIAIISDYSSLYAYEVTPYRGEFNPSLPNPATAMGGNMPGETIFIVLQCRVGQGEYSRRFGSPMCLRVWRDLTYSQLQSVVFKHMRQYLHDEVNPEVVCRDYIFFKCLVLDGLQGQEYLDPYCPAPLMSPSVEKALSVSKMWGYEPHIKIIAEWEEWVKDTVCSDIPESPDDPIHPSVQLIREHYNTPLEASLDDCLEWHTKDEKLDEDETYTCHHCGKSQAGANKRISFWTLPDILVIHLKRFELDEYSHSKLNTLIKYPVRGLDMTPYLARPDQSRPSSAMGFRDHVLMPSANSSAVTSSSSGAGASGSMRKTGSKSSLEKQGSSSTLPLKGVGFEDLRKAPKDCAHPKSKQKFVWKKSKKAKKDEKSVQLSTSNGGTAGGGRKESNLYDLYAVCNHHGNMDSGHYISYCCNPVDGRWYTFDDHRVLPITDPEQLVTVNAYILFYMRRGARTRHTPSSAVDSTITDDHWVNKLKIDLSRVIPSIPEPKISKAQRQASVGSAQTLSTSSGVSPDYMTTPLQRSDNNIPPRSGHTHLILPSSPPGSLYHTHQSSDGPLTSPSHSTVGGVYPQSLPSPSCSSSVSYFSHQSQPFTKRVGSYHGNSHHSAVQSKQRERTTTRL